jgi:imidazolonepropionase-like amidohydrolase
VKINRFLSAVCLAACCAGAAFAETKVLQGFTLIDGNGRRPVSPAAMIVTDGRIQWVGAQAQLKKPAGAETIDLSGKFVMPGIINLHGHVGNTLDLDQDAKFATRENVEKQLAMYASYGVTSVASMGTDQPAVIQVRAEQHTGRPHATRVFSAGRGFTGPAGYPTHTPGMGGVPFEVSSPEQAAMIVTGLAGANMDLVKMWVDDHLGREKKISLDVAKAIIAEAHKHQLKVAAHIFYLDDAKILVDAGLDNLAHSVRDQPVDRALIAAMKKNGTYQTATLSREISLYYFAQPRPALADPFFIRSVSAKVLDTLKSPEFQKKTAADPDHDRYPQFLSMAKRNLKTLFDAGVKIGFGTDSGPPGRFQGYFEHWEMELMVESGLTPAQVITAATKTSAAFLGAKDLGTLEAGKWADLIVLSKNPLDEIKNSRAIEMVMIAGNRI